MTVTAIEIEKPADAIIIAAPYAPAGPIVAATSNTPANPAVGGTYTFRVNEGGLGFVPGFRVRAAAQVDPLSWIEGIVTEFDGVNLTLESDLSDGIGVYDSWFINVAGEQGMAGPEGPPGPQGPPGGAGLPEAPMDGYGYGRRNGQWAQVLLFSGDILDGGNF